jgi:hypothetical protein
MIEHEKAIYGGFMKRVKIAREKRVRVVDSDAKDWFLAIDCCLT